MNYKKSLPSGVNADDIVFSLPFNLSGDAKKVNGHLVFDGENLQFYIDEKLEKEYPLTHFDEYTCQENFGSGQFIGKISDEPVILCGMSRDLFLNYTEIVKLFNHRLKTGEIDLSLIDEVYCDKCATPLNGAELCTNCTKKTHVLRELLKIAKPYRLWYIILLFFSLLSVTVWILMPQLQKIMIDEYVTPKNAYLSGFLVIVLGFVLLIVLSAVCNYVTMRSSLRFSMMLGRDLKQKVFEKCQSLSLSNISKRSAGELINRTSNDCSKIQGFLADYGIEAIIDALTIVVLTIVLFFLNPTLAILVLSPFPVVFVIANVLYNKMNIKFGKVWRMITRYNSTIHDILNGIRVVKSYGNEDREIEKYTEASLNVAKANTAAERTWYFTMMPTNFIMSIGTFLTVFFGGRMVIRGEMTLGQLVQFTSYVGILYSSVRWVLDLPKTLSDTWISANKVFEILNEKSSADDKNEEIDIDIKGDIEFDDVSFGYLSYIPVLKDISLKINQGEMIGIVGYSGVGKSTLVNLILRLYDCSEGRILIDGVDIKKINQESLRSQIGFVLQETFLFYGTIAENIGYAKPDASFHDIINAAKIANCHEFITKLPDGYNTRVGDKGYTLSGGERQRIAIARAILHDPKIIILDEATASLDTQTEKQIQEALSRLTKGRTTLAIAHRLSTLSKADKLIVLNKGKLAEFGTHMELLKSGGVYHQLVMAQRQTAKMRKLETTNS